MTRIDTELVLLARCPRCEGQLEAADGALACQACRGVFESLGPVATLLRERDTLARSWRQQLAAFQAMMLRAREELEQELGRFDLLASTRARLEKIREANLHNTRSVLALFERCGLVADPIALERERHRASSATELVKHFEHLLRDWAWEPGDAGQNHDSCQRLLEALGNDRSLGRVLVLGAGGCRLAYDLHRRLAPELTLALDLDPFALLVAQAALFEDGVELMETPIDPLNDAEAALLRHLRRAGEPPARFALLLADAFEAPFAEASFDTIVTPWFLDVAAEDCRDVIGLVDHLLRPGGRWLNDGALLYTTSDFDLRFSKLELLELLTLGGFQIEHQSTCEAPYLHSPASAHARTEGVHTFSARKPLQAPAPTSSGDLPAWLVLRHLSVPAFRAGVAPAHPVLAQVLALVDGKRSLNEITERLEQVLKPPPQLTVGDIVGGLLLQHYRDTRGAG